MAKGYVDKQAQQTVYSCLSFEPRTEEEIVRRSGYDLAFTRGVLKNLVRNGLAKDVSTPAAGSAGRRQKPATMYIRAK